ncbi:MAG TPA: hypothetical protein PLI43_04040 [Albidovulum sp.]|jgi:hypothetical protein|uniref:hypothetical protein n=1 Tax=Albidovulum sp. TaxID=1872424 RepID=UPI002CCB2129|nr:hypothetical protein [Albidovulum sp.]
MGAALSIVILFTVTTTIVRIAGLVLEHSGIPRHVARLQAVSALTGAGFTTSESELLLQTPERRHVLVALMVTGSIGLGSLIATVVVGAFGVSTSMTGLLGQLGAVAAAIIYLRYVLLTPWADRLICSLASRWLSRTGAGKLPFLVLHRLGEDAMIAEHRLVRHPPENPADWGAAAGLIPVALRNADGIVHNGWSGLAGEGQNVILCGRLEAHAAFATAFGTPIENRGH